MHVQFCQTPCICFSCFVLTNFFQVTYPYSWVGTLTYIFFSCISLVRICICIWYMHLYFVFVLGARMQLFVLALYSVGLPKSDWSDALLVIWTPFLLSSIQTQIQTQIQIQIQKQIQLQIQIQIMYSSGLPKTDRSDALLAIWNSFSSWSLSSQHQLSIGIEVLARTVQLTVN